MIHRFSKSFPTERIVQDWIVMAALVLGVSAGICHAPAQEAQPTKEPKSYIRFWNMLPVIPANVLLVYLGNKNMFGVAPGDVHTDYFAFPVGSFSLAIRRTDEKQEPVAKVPVAMQAGTFITLLAIDKGGGKVDVQLINDTPDPKVTDLTAQLVVRSFCTGGNVTVGMTGGQPAQPVPGGGMVKLDNLPMTAGLNIAVQVTVPTTPPTSRRWDLPADFSVTHHATLLLLSDQYGRLKPQLVYDGLVANPDSSRDRDKDRR